VEERRIRDRDVVRDDAVAVRERQRVEFGGLNWGAAFFGWLVAVGLAVILIALFTAAGATLGLTEAETGEADVETITLAGGILLIAALAVAYFAGGYVAGRMSRFDGARQGIGVWIIGLLVTVALGIAGAIAGSEYNVFERFDLPRVPIDEGDLTTGALIALGVTLIATLVAAALGGKTGERYHRRVDLAGHER
jgi:MFS family permease